MIDLSFFFLECLKSGFSVVAYKISLFLMINA